MKKTIFLTLIALIQCTYAQWFDPQTIQTTVLIEKMVEKNKLSPHGTGFLLYNYHNPKEYAVITCAHLIKGRKEIFVRMNIDSSILSNFKKEKVAAIFAGNKSWMIRENNLILKIQLNRAPPTFVIDTLLDIGAFLINIPIAAIVEDSAKIAMKVASKLGIPKSQITYRKELKLGDEVYFIGFPFNLGADNTISPIVRSGSIAWLPLNHSFFLLDALSYGGNSGSPIFSKVLFGTKVGHMEWDPPKLVGMITGHHGMKIENVLTQPDTTLLKFEKGSVETNFGLATCVYMDDILQLVNKLTNDMAMQYH